MNIKTLKHGDIQNINCNRDKKNEHLMYGMPFYVITHRSYKLLTMVQFHAHTAVCIAVHNV